MLKNMHIVVETGVMNLTKHTLGLPSILLCSLGLLGCAEILGIDQLSPQPDTPPDAAPADAALAGDAPLGAIDAGGPDAPVTPPCVPPPSNIIAWWDGESVGNDVTGAYSNPAVIGNPITVPGVVGNATRYGTNDLLAFNPAPTGVGDDFTLEAWVYLDRAHTGYFGIYGRFFETAICMYNSRLVIWDSNLGGGGVGNLVTSESELHERWTHIAITWDGTQGVLYINGVVEDSNTTNAPIFLPPIAEMGGLVNFMNGNALVDRFEGNIDELTLYERALGASEIQAIYNASTAGKCKP